MSAQNTDDKQIQEAAQALDQAIQKHGLNSQVAAKAAQKAPAKAKATYYSGLARQYEAMDDLASSEAALLASLAADGVDISDLI